MKELGFPTLQKCFIHGVVPACSGSGTTGIPDRSAILQGGMPWSLVYSVKTVKINKLVLVRCISTPARGADSYRRAVSLLPIEMSSRRGLLFSNSVMRSADENGLERAGMQCTREKFHQETHYLRISHEFNRVALISVMYKHC